VVGNKDEGGALKLMPPRKQGRFFPSRYVV